MIGWGILALAHDVGVYDTHPRAAGNRDDGEA